MSNSGNFSADMMMTISSSSIGLSLFWTAASARKLELPSISKYLSAGPARLCGLENRKGALRTGLEADLVFFDPEATFVVIAESVRHKNKVRIEATSKDIFNIA